MKLNEGERYDPTVHGVPSNPMPIILTLWVFAWVIALVVWAGCCR